MGYYLFSLLLFFIGFTEVRSQGSVGILTYDSMVGKKSFGEWLSVEFAKECSDCQIKFIPTKDLATLFQKVSADFNREDRAFDGVLGFSEAEVVWAQKRKFLEKSVAYEWSPFGVLFNVAKSPIPEVDGMEDFLKSLQSKILVQDPRLGQTGQAWLSFLYELNKFSDSQIRALKPRVFPSWSSSYEAFLKNLGDAVWTYKTSFIYHKCEGSEVERRDIKVLGLGSLTTPLQVNFFSILNKPSKSSRTLVVLGKFEKFLLSSRVQSEILKKNWMLPVDKKIDFPECAKEVTSWAWPKSFEPHPRWSEADFKKALDKWSLL